MILMEEGNISGKLRDMYLRARLPAPDRTYRNFRASKSRYRLFQTTQNLLIAKSSGPKIVMKFGQGLASRAIEL